MRTLLVIAAIAALLFAGGCSTGGEIEVGRNAAPCVAPSAS